MNMNLSHFLLVALLAFASSGAFAYDPSPLQDFCVAINDTNNGVFVNGKFCKDPKLVNANDFFYSGLNQGNTSNQLGSRVNLLNVDKILGFNTLGISLVRIDFAPKGLNPPHFYPRASEILTVLEGTLYAGFITSNPENHLFVKVLNKGDVFVFPFGHIHFQLNVGYGNAVAIATLSSQNPGVATVANTVFGSTPPISSEVPTKAFQLDQKIVDYLQKHTTTKILLSLMVVPSAKICTLCYSVVKLLKKINYVVSYVLFESIYVAKISLQ